MASITNLRLSAHGAELLVLVTDGDDSVGIMVANSVEELDDREPIWVSRNTAQLLAHALIGAAAIDPEA